MDKSSNIPRAPGYYRVFEQGMPEHVVEVRIASESHGTMEAMPIGDDIWYPVDLWKERFGRVR